MASESEVLLKLINAKSRVQVIPGAYRGIEDDRALVDFDGGRVPANTVGVLPSVNEAVWVWVIDGVPFMMGPTSPRPSEGTVVSAASGSATVSTVIGNITARYDDAVLSPTTSDEVFLVWGDGAFIAGVTVAVTAAEVPDAPGAGTQTRYTRDFTAIDSGSYQSGIGWRTNDVWSSASNIGAWFYGTKIKDTIPDSADIVRAQIFLPTPIQLLGARPFGRHNQASKPAGAVTITDTETLGTSGWQDIDTGHIDALKAGDGGVGFALGGYNIWPGTQKHGGSGMLRVTYDI